ncbi:MAG: hypothetical protein FWE49_06895 [Synergistaceae bacterium]|nr:hypothetical protein [Synergistaceae bacterium]
MPSWLGSGEGDVGVGELDHNDDRTLRGHRERHVSKELRRLLQKYLKIHQQSLQLTAH